MPIPLAGLSTSPHRRTGELEEQLALRICIRLTQTQPTIVVPHICYHLTFEGVRHSDLFREICKVMTWCHQRERITPKRCLA